MTFYFQLKLEEAVWNFIKCGNLEHTKWECFEKAAEVSQGDRLAGLVSF